MVEKLGEPVMTALLYAFCFVFPALCSLSEKFRDTKVSTLFYWLFYFFLILFPLSQLQIQFFSQDQIPQNQRQIGFMSKDLAERKLGW